MLCAVEGGGKVRANVHDYRSQSNSGQSLRISTRQRRSNGTASFGDEDSTLCTTRNMDLPISPHISDDVEYAVDAARSSSSASFDQPDFRRRWMASRSQGMKSWTAAKDDASRANDWAHLR